MSGAVLVLAGVIFNLGGRHFDSTFAITVGAFLIGYGFVSSFLERRA